MDASHIVVGIGSLRRTINNLTEIQTGDVEFVTERIAKFIQDELGSTAGIRSSGGHFLSAGEYGREARGGIGGDSDASNLIVSSGIVGIGKTRIVKNAAASGSIEPGGELNGSVLIDSSIGSTLPEEGSIGWNFVVDFGARI